MINKKKLPFYYIALIFGTLLFILPFVYMVIASTQSNPEIVAIPPKLGPSTHSVENIQKLDETYDYFTAFKNTIIVTIIGTFGATLFNSMAGYAFAKFNFKGQDILFKLLLFTSMIPGFSTMLPMFIIFSRIGLLNTYASLIIPGLAGAATIFMMRQYMYAVPTDVLESARIDGAGELAIFFKIVVPMNIPAIVTGALTIFVGYWNSYIWPLISVTDADFKTLSLVIRNMGAVQEDLWYGARYMGLTLSVIPIIIFYIIIQTKMKNTGVSDAVK